MPGTSIRTHLALVLAGASLLTAAALAFLVNHWATQVIKDASISSLGAVAQERKNAIVRLLEARRARVQTFLAGVERTCSGRPAARACVQQQLERYMPQEPARRLEQVPLATVDALFGLAYLPDLGPVIAVTAATPGGLAARLFLPPTFFDDLFIAGGPLGVTGQSFLVDREGRLVTSSERLKPVTNPWSTRTSSLPLERCLTGESGEAIAANFLGEPSVHGFRALPEVGGGCVVVQMTTREAFAAADRLTRGILTAAPLFAGVAAAFSLLLARRLTRPLRHLTDAARAVQEGKLEVQIQTNQGPKEFRQLCATFSAMIAALRDSAEFKDRLLGVLGHDLRNPLSAVRMAAQSLSRRSADHLSLRSASVIVRSAERMTRLVNQLLDMARARSPVGLEVHTVEIDLATLVTAVVDEMRTAYPERRMQLDCAGDACGEWDPDRLAQVASNLVANALQHGSDGTVRVVVDATSDAEVRVWVHNVGTPIPRETIDDLFQPYRRGRSAHGQGAGLGLYVVDQVVRAHGGRVLVESSEEAGTTFTVVLPRTLGCGPSVSVSRGQPQPAAAAPPA